MLDLGYHDVVEGLVELRGVVVLVVHEDDHLDSG